MFLGLLFSCSQVPKKVDGTATNITTIDTTINIANSSTEKYYSVERGHYVSKDYLVMVKSNYLLTDTLKNDSSYYCQGNFLYLIDKVNKILDSIELAEGCESGIIIQDVTQSLHFKTPLFNISTPSGSDYYTCEFIGYSDSLKKLFEIPEFGRPAALEWKDKHTLTGFIKDRDELVNDFQDYPVTVSLDNYEVKYEKPAKQKIGYTTKVLYDFSGYRLPEGIRQTKYLIKKGTTIFIDSLNRSTNTVRIIVNDTVVIYVPFSNIKDKVQINAAG
jgi:hypothetical protein